MIIGSFKFRPQQNTYLHISNNKQHSERLRIFTHPKWQTSVILNYIMEGRAMESRKNILFYFKILKFSLYLNYFIGEGMLKSVLATCK